MKFFHKSYTDYTDEELMRLIRKRNCDAFNEIYSRYSKRLLYYFYRMLGASEDKAQDFLQDLFLKVLEKSDLFNPEQKFSTWIFSIAANQCKNEYRRTSVRNSYLKAQKAEENMDFSGNSHHQADDKIDHRALQKALIRELEKFDHSFKNIFILRYQENMSVREISEMTGHKEGTVKSRLFYMTKKLAQNLWDFHPLYGGTK
jgi:RNA polymerase sigma-70 factor (ECF subfamily)